MAATARLAPTVEIIPATIFTDVSSRRKKLRVAAYCRVSTDSDDQLQSYETQVRHYTAEIKKNPDWINVGIFADEGITGVMTKKRDEFNKMIELCRAGKIDRILTKSTSRFARNTVDSLRYIRELKALGISIYFEKENIDTLKMDSETIITVYSAFAQAESESISGNIKLGKRYKYKAGDVPMMYGKILGYRKGDDGNPQIIPEEAKIIRFIYDAYLNGNGYAQICKLLEEKEYKTINGKTTWAVGVVKSILTNEKYKGDVIMQKTYVSDLFTKSIKVNRGELPMYLVRNHHEPIIEPEIFDRVQVEIARRNSLKALTDKGATPNSRHSKYALTGLIECSECGAKYRRTTWARGGVKKVVWRCVSRLEYGTRYCKDSPTIEEERIHNGVVKAINMMLDNTEEIRSNLYGAIAEVLATSKTDKDVIEHKAKIDTLNAEIMNAIEEGVKERKSRTEIEEYCKNKYQEVSALQEKLTQATMKQQVGSINKNYLTEIYDHVAQVPGKLTEYDDVFARQTVTKVRILSENQMDVTLYGAVTFTIDI